MIKEIDKIITSGALSVNKILDKSRNRSRDIHIEHPEAKVYEAVKAQANLSSQINLESHSDNFDNDQAIANLQIFDGDLADIDW